VDILVCGAQKPFMRGGAEMLMENLVEALTEAGHQTELVRLPVAWEKDRIFDSPLAWRLTPADADLVIALNFPSYFVQHPNKIVWLLHQHRGAYDAAEASWSDFGLDDPALEAQRQLTEWDCRALGEARKIYTISGVVADRLAYYSGLQGTPVYHPPPLADRLSPGPFGDYVVCPTRLERNKRPEKVVSALSHSTLRAVVTGRGGMFDELREQARHHGVAERLELPGFVSDDTLVDLIRHSLAVVYAPLDEDYGYVTLQAFLAGKGRRRGHWPGHGRLAGADGGGARAPRC
jgi:glycosyltransferase involved in cell wall biosynthesis